MAYRTVLKILLILLAITSLTQCKPRSASISNLEGYVTPGVRWPNAKASVCWENPETVDAKYLEFAEKRVISEYNNRTIFKFSTNWQKCLPNSKGIRIFLKDSDSRFVQDFGVRIDGVKNGMQLNLSFVETDWPTCRGDNLYFCIGDDALHEFGHAIGLRHEANRRDSPCYLDQTGGRGEQGAIPLGAYDPNSIMNYCAATFNQRNHLAVLSDEDIKTINEYYSASEEDLVSQSGNAQCQAEGNEWSPEGSCCIPTSGNLQSSAQRNFDYCQNEFAIAFPKLNLRSKYVDDSAEIAQLEGVKVESIEPKELNLRCRENGREYYASGWVSTSDLLAGQGKVWFPNSGRVLCDSLHITAELTLQPVGDDSNFEAGATFNVVPYILSFPLTALDAGSAVKFGGTWRFNEENFEIEPTVRGQVDINFAQSDSQIFGLAAALICDEGRFQGQVARDEPKASFWPEFNSASRGATISCSAIEAYPGGSQRSSGSFYRLTFPRKVHFAAGSDKEIDMRQARFTSASEGSYPVCEANNGRGFGEPFRCGDSDCSKKSIEAAQSNSQDGWCLFRPSDNQKPNRSSSTSTPTSSPSSGTSIKRPQSGGGNSVGGYSCEQQKAWGKCGESWMHPVCSSVCGTGGASGTGGNGGSQSPGVWTDPSNGKQFPYCASGASDTDNDGWGWENNTSCKVR